MIRASLTAFAPCIVAALWAPGCAAAQSTAAAAALGQASATIVAPIRVVREDDLDFGLVAVTPNGAGPNGVGPNGAGTVTIAPFGGPTYRGAAGPVCASACPGPHAARFSLTGEPGRRYQITLPERLVLSPEGAAAGQQIVVDSLVAATASGGVVPRGTLTHGGIDRFEVGGTLHVPAQPEPARYTTQVPVIVEYM